MQDNRCEECDYCDYDEETDTYECLMALDMDEYERFLSSGRNRCPFFRVRNEYHTVHRQN